MEDRASAFQSEEARLLRGRSLRLTNLILNGHRFLIEEKQQQAAIQTVSVNGEEVTIELLKVTVGDPLQQIVKVGERVYRVVVERSIEDRTKVSLNGRKIDAHWGIEEAASHTRKPQGIVGPAIVTAPMSGRIASLKVGAGSRAEEGQVLVILEAMKMENEIASPKGGMVKEVYVQAGALVRAGDKLVLVE